MVDRQVASKQRNLSITAHARVSHSSKYILTCTSLLRDRKCDARTGFALRKSGIAGSCHTGRSYPSKGSIYGLRVTRDQSSTGNGRAQSRFDESVFHGLKHVRGYSEIRGSMFAATLTVQLQKEAQGLCRRLHAKQCN